MPIIFDNLSDIDIQLNDIIYDQFVMEDLTSQRDIRLIDPKERTASHIGVFTYEREAEQGTSFNSLETVLGTGSRNERTTMDPEHEPAYYYVVFEAPVSEDIHVLLPKLGLVENVPVVARDEAELPTVAEFDEAALTDEADRELEAALLELEGVEGGVLDIVGHTDNQGSEEYNQELSEERAASVEARLGELADLEQFDEKFGWRLIQMK